MSASGTVTRSTSLRKRVTALLASTAMLVSGGISLAAAPAVVAVPVTPLACDSVATQQFTIAPSEALSLDLDPATCGRAAVVSAPGYFGVGTVWLHVVTPSGIQHLSAGESVANASYDWVRFVAPSTVQAAAVQFTVGSVSFEIAVVAPATVPGAPQSLTATGGASKIDLAWSAPASDGGSGVTGYRIDVSDTDASSGFTSLVATQPGLTYADASLADGATRYYRVYAINLIGTSATYAEATATTNAAPGSNTVPGVPASATAVGGVSEATFTWTAPVNDGGLPVTYSVTYSTTNAETGFSGFRAGLTDLSYTERQLADGQQVWFRVHAENSLGLSAGYAEATATTLTPIDQTHSIGCVAGQTVAFTLAPGERLVLNMDPACHAVRKLAAGNAWHAQAFDTTLGGYPFDLNNSPPMSTPDPLTPFRYTAVADTFGYAMSDQFFVTPDVNSGSLIGTTVRIAVTGPLHPQTVPDAPRYVDATATGATTADVSFNAPVSDGYSPITSYTVTSSPAGGTGTLSGAAGGTAQVTGLTTGTAYTFTVTATNGVGTSVPSDPSNAVTPALPPPPGPPPANDDIENAVALPADSVTASGDNTDATLQQGEYNWTGDPGTHTVWFTWTAPESSAGTATIDTCGSSFDTTLAVFAAGTFTTPIIENDDDCETQSSVTLPVTPGASYSIQVNGYNSSEYGAIVLNYSVAGGTATPVVPTPGGGGGSSSPAADSGSGSSEPAVMKPVTVTVPVKVPVVSTLLPAAATALIRQTARITAPSSRGLAVGTHVVLAAKPVKTSAGVRVRWSRTTASAGVCSVATAGGRAVATMLKPGTCRVVGTAEAPSRDYAVFQATRTYRVR